MSNTIISPYLYPGLDPKTQAWVRQKTCFNTSELTIIANSVCEVCDISLEDLKSPVRRAELNDSRKIFFHLARRLYLFTHIKLGKYLGRDHSTVVVALGRCEDYLVTDPIFKELYVNSLLTIIRNLRNNGYTNYKHTNKQIMTMSEVYMSNEINKYESR